MKNRLAEFGVVLGFSALVWLLQCTKPQWVVTKRL